MDVGTFSHDRRPHAPPSHEKESNMNANTGDLAVGFIGLGVMGTPMVSHLHKAGYRVTLHDLDINAGRDLASSLGKGAVCAASPREVAESSDVVITMLPNGRVVQQVALGDDGLAQGFKKGALLLDTSSSEPWLTKETAERLAAHGVSMVDAPVSGAQWGAEKAELVFMVGADPQDLERVRPLLDRMGTSVFHLGPVGAGHAMKCINNLITAVTFAATAEGLVVGKACGLDPEAMVQVLNASTGGSWISQNHIQRRVISRSFDDPFKLELMLKDVGIANALAREAALPIPLSALTQQLWQAASLASGPGASVSDLARWVERQSGVEITPGAAPRT
jgi:3-hydroxyisobutyrate dehydrogenase